MEPVEALERHGGAASHHQVVRLTSRRRLSAAVRGGQVVKVSRRRYALATASDARRAAAELAGTMCLRSAAAHHGWAMKLQPPKPEVAVSPRRHLAPERRAGVRVLWMPVAADDAAAGVTGPLKTVIDCARHLPFDEALAIADSALRAGAVTRAELDAVRVRGAGAAAVRRVLAHADGRAANPFESVLRALCLDAQLDAQPQLAIDLGSGTVRPDLVVPSLRVVLEADSWTFHATRGAHARDCARYNLLVIHGWRVFRFTWEQVMHEQPYVRWVLAQVVRPVEQEEVVGGLAATA